MVENWAYSMVFSMVVAKGTKRDIRKDSQLEVWMVAILVVVKAKL